MSPKAKIVLAVVILAVAGVAGAVFFSLRAGAPTVDDIAAATSITDAEAVSRMAGILFTKAAISTEEKSDGVAVKITYTGRDEAEVKVLKMQDRDMTEDAAVINKASLVTLMTFRLRRLLRCGELRGLSHVDITLYTTVLDSDDKPTRIRIYAVSVPKEKFQSIRDLKTTREFLFSADKKLAELGVVEFDGFDQIEYQR